MQSGEASGAGESENLIFFSSMCCVAMQVGGIRLLVDGKDSLWWFAYVSAR